MIWRHCMHLQHRQNILTRLHQLSLHTHTHTGLCLESSRVVFIQEQETETFHLLASSMTDGGSVLFVLGFDTDAALIIVLVNCQSSCQSVNVGHPQLNWDDKYKIAQTSLLSSISFNSVSDHNLNDSK